MNFKKWYEMKKHLLMAWVLLAVVGTSCGKVTSGGGEDDGGDTAEENGDKTYVEMVADLNMKMVFVEGGDFMMGGTEEQGEDAKTDEFPVRRITLDSFYIGESEVTQAQWEKVMGVSIQEQAAKSVLQNPPTPGIGPDFPIYYVSWEEAREFCERLSRMSGRTYCLPSEAQWEYASRGGKNNDGTKYSGSDVIGDVAWYGDHVGSDIRPIKNKEPNGLGLYDMSGNVNEWCEDLYDDYNKNDTHNPTGPAPGYRERRVFRGGGFLSAPSDCRVSARFAAYTELSGFGGQLEIGFRVAALP